jgi:hypothetical protein
MDASQFQGRLLKGEKVVWWGQPKRGLLFTRRDWLLVPFSLFWAGFIVFWETNVLRANGATFMKLWGVPFMLIGIYLVVGRYVVDAWVRRGTHYALTNRRVLILRSAPFSRFVALSLDQLPSTNLTEHGRGRGTIRFGADVPLWGGRGFAGWTPSLDPTPQFLAIEEAARVFDHIQSGMGHDR